MNVYDFDNTVHVPDSSCCFVLYCLRHYPRAVLTALPRSAWEFLRYVRGGRQDATRLKEALFSFLNRLDDVHRIVDEFWAGRDLEEWYLQQARPDDLIISASPEFLLRPVAERNGFSLIATEMDPYSGRIRGLNCHDREKVRRFLERYRGEKVENFYSDSLVDTPMARLAEAAWLVRDHKPTTRWPHVSC